MADLSRIQAMIDDASIAHTLKQGSTATADIKILQEVLHNLGFGQALEWDRFGPDGDYGGATTNAVAAFAAANGVAADGTSVNTKLGRLLIERADFLDEMQHMHEAATKPSVLSQLRLKSPAKVAITVLQNILHALGYDEEMNWAKYGADGEYGKGTTKAVKAFADAEGLASDGLSVTKEMAERALAKFAPFYGPDWMVESPKIVQESLKITASDKNVTVADQEVSKTFRKYKLGLYTAGNVVTAGYISANRAELKKAGMSDSALNVMLGVSENEGNIDAINTWDSAFMSFGMFQWTVGQGSATGELPALFKKIKDGAPDRFDALYGRLGLDVSPKTSDTQGYLKLNGQVLNSPQEKEQLRAPRWCFYFWKAGQDPTVQRISLQHAFSRIGTFARSSGYQVDGHDVADVVTSEYGMALVLDNHVNRPGYIAGCLTQAVKSAGLQGSNPAGWGTAEERRVLDAYLTIRQTYGGSPMTDAKKRGEVTAKYVKNGVISDQRGSFKM